jgi:hypothetical protein
VQEQGNRLDGPVHIGPLDSVEYVCPDTRALVGRAPALNELLIPSGPLLYKSRRKRRGKAKDQTEEPQDVNPDGSGGGFK